MPVDEEEVLAPEKLGVVVPERLEALEPEQLQEHLLALDESEDHDHNTSEGQLLGMADRSKTEQSTRRGWFRRPTEVQSSPKPSTKMPAVEPTVDASGEDEKGKDHMDSSEAGERRRKVGWFARKTAVDSEAMKMDGDEDHVATEKVQSEATDLPKKRASFWFGRPASSSLLSEEPEPEQAPEEADEPSRPSAPAQDQRLPRARRTISQQARLRRTSTNSSRSDSTGPLRRTPSNTSERDPVARSVRGRSSDGASVDGTVQSRLRRSNSFESASGQSMQERREANRARRQGRRESLSTNKGVR